MANLLRFVAGTAEHQEAQASWIQKERRRVQHLSTLIEKAGGFSLTDDRFEALKSETERLMQQRADEETKLAKQVGNLGWLKMYAHVERNGESKVCPVLEVRYHKGR